MTNEVFAGKNERYEVVRPLGEGGFGVTHLATRTSGGRRVVVKQLRMDRLGDWKAFDLFEREAAVLESLRHPNIPAFVDHFECKVRTSVACCRSPSIAP
jgi:eukaryotic-like serine/threonine-protein kinase